ncbi:MAG TPA: RNA pseudouridine synthase [Spirochaetia bacterium]|nr:RNA pseudouridine synthase [Spirochaetia bacterium]
MNNSPKRNKPQNSPHGAASTHQTTFIVGEAGELLQFLRERLTGKGRNAVKSLLAHHAVSVDGATVSQFDHPLSAGQKVTVDRSGNPGNREVPRNPAAGGKSIRGRISGAEANILRAGMRILFEDESIAVVEKPAGLLSVATGKGDEQTAYNLLWDHVAKEGEGRRIFVVHRLDRDASGIMMFAKDPEVKKTLQSEWDESVVERSYLVVVEGQIAQPAGTITSWLRETKSLHIRSSRVPDDGKKAISHYRVVRSTPAYSLVEVTLETGRKNQIRVHMCDLGNPVVGDKKYGSEGNPIRRLALHAFRLVFRHPTSGELMRFETEVPREFLRLVGPEKSTSARRTSP